MAGFGARSRMTAPAPVAPPPLVRSLSCPNCGGAIEQRMGSWTQTIACGQCGATLDASEGSLAVLQRAERQLRIRPRIPLGSRGTLGGVLWEITGFQRRQIVVDETAYSWDEYLLFNPWRGFRYLSEYGGHWNEIEPVSRPPRLGEAGGRPIATLDRTTFKHFQTAEAETVFVLGEFPWEIRRGDRVATRDFIAPPWILSEEGTALEATWSRGHYRTPAEIAQAFPAAIDLPPVSGVFANQPSPHAGRAKRVWRTWALLMVALVGMFIANHVLAARTVLFTERYTYDQSAVQGQSATAENGGPFVTPVFTASGRTSNIEVAIDSDIDQDWMYFNVALISVATGTAREFGRELSYYSGRDSDGSWSEGSRSDVARIPAVPAGPYYLRIEPEGGDLGRIGRPPVSYRLTVRRDVPNNGFYGMAVLVLLVPALFAGVREAAFEGTRWAESDYGTASGSGGSDEE